MPAQSKMLAAAAIDIVDEQAEGDEPHDGDEEVDRVVDKLPLKGNSQMMARTMERPATTSV